MKSADRINPYVALALGAAYLAAQTGFNAWNSRNLTPSSPSRETAAAFNPPPVFSQKLDLTEKQHLPLDIASQPRDVQLVLQRPGFMDWMTRFEKNCGSCAMIYDRRSYGVVFEGSTPQRILPSSLVELVLSLANKPKKVTASGMLIMETGMREEYAVVHVNSYGEGYFLRKGDNFSITLNPGESRKPNAIFLVPAELNEYSGTKAVNTALKRD